ncbi:MAG: Na/Pi cotransporter family protein [Eubacterium sp.]|nr:Na/Pi cotransporter family protein [Eubacterium sp.]
MDIMSILKLLGGIGMFLYGMNLLDSSIGKFAGGALERRLERVTTDKKKRMNPIKGWGLGMGVTAVVQSSAATTIMLVGFINAGIMKVAQALPAVFGANVGSTMTAQILRLGDVGEGSIAAELVSPIAVAPLLAGIGAFIILFIKSDKMKNIAGVLVGLGLLFYGMLLMEEVFEMLRDIQEFRAFVDYLRNPILGVVLGIIVTILLQSSTASVGVLQALTVTGIISYSVAIPIIIGENLGKCSTTFIRSIGSNRNSKRLVVGHLLFNLAGAVIFSAIILILNNTVGLAFMSDITNRGSIATVHLLFNLIASLVLIPFSETIAKFTEKIVGGVDKKSDGELVALDDMLLNTPTVALEQCREVMGRMSDAIIANYELAVGLIYEYDESKMEMLEENESFIDQCETALSAYVIRIDRKRLTHENKLLMHEILNSIGDFERMGDYCMNIAYVAKEKNEQGISFSKGGHDEVGVIISAVEYVLETTMSAFRDEDMAIATRVEPLYDAVNDLKEVIKGRHIERLQEGICSSEGGVSLFDMINSFERISAHAANVSLHVIKKAKDDSSFDEMHGHATDNHSDEYKALYRYYASKYIDPVISVSAISGHGGSKGEKEKHSKKKKKSK